MLNNEHLTERELEKYVESMLFDENISDDPEIRNTEKHISECDECAARANKIYRELKALLEWNVYRDNILVLKERIKNSLKKIEGECANPEHKSRIRRWCDGFSGLSGGNFKVFVDVFMGGRRRKTRIINESIEKLNVKNAFQFEYGLEFVSGRNGTEAGIVNMLSMESVNGEKPVRISLSKLNKELIVEFDFGRNEKIPLAMLLPMDPEQATLFSEPFWDEQKKVWIMKFEEIPSGEYFFMLEPIRW